MTDKGEGTTGAELGETLPRTRPPQEPEAFSRWLGLETLKADLKRLELEKLRYAQGRRRSGFAFSIVALVLVLLLAGLSGYLATQLSQLNGEVARLSMAQADLRDALEAVDAQLSAAATSAPANAAASGTGTPQLTWSPPPGISSRSVAPETIPGTPPGGAAAPTTVPPTGAASDAGSEPVPTPAADSYSVRIFGSANANLKNKMEAFAATVKAAGFKVDVSNNDVFQPLANSISFHASSAGKAEELARALKAKYPKIQFEMKLSEAITDSMRRIIIVNLTDEALN